jgi:Predicted hydrolases of HD superfamily
MLQTVEQVIKSYEPIDPAVGRPIHPYIETYTGKQMYFLEPTPDMICIEDIAHALSNICRFGGHTKEFYSVAEHSIAVARLSKNELEGLLHDASEAYLIDIPKPIKGYLKSYGELEKKLMSAIALKYGAGWPISADTKDADVIQLVVEAKSLLLTGGKEWVGDWKTIRKTGIEPQCYSPKEAEELFLHYFESLTNAK